AGELGLSAHRAWRAADAGHAAAQGAGGLVPRLLAGDLRGRPPGARGVHVRGRAEPWAAAAVPGAVAERDGAHAAAAERPLADVPLALCGDRAVRATGGDRTTGREARQRDIAASALGGVLHRARGRARRDSDLPRASDRAVLAPLGVRPRLDPAGRERVVVRARLPPARAGAGVVRDRG